MFKVPYSLTSYLNTDTFLFNLLYAAYDANIAAVINIKLVIHTIIIL